MGHARVEKRIGMGFCAAALPHLLPGLLLSYSSSVSSITCDRKSSMERRRLSPSPPMSACETTQ
eukprot:6999843-Prymnesium_polylepis.1